MPTPHTAAGSQRLRFRLLPKVRKPAALERVLRYENPPVLHSFMDKYAVTARQAKSIFVETQKFLWLMARARHRGVPTPFVTPELLVIDEMWHTFVLFTAEYRRYCERYFGFYLDHLPTTRAERAIVAREFRRDPAGSMQRWDAELRAQLGFIYDELGASTVLRWYKRFGERYSPARLEELRSQRARRELERTAAHGTV